MKKLSNVLDSLTDHDTDSENKLELPKTKWKFDTNQTGNDSCRTAIEIDPSSPYQTTTLFESTRLSALTRSFILATSSILSGHSTLIGASNERARHREENKRANEESLSIDMERERAARESKGINNTSGDNVSSNLLGPIMYEGGEEQKWIELINKRKEKTPKEPDISQGPCVISVRHVLHGLIRCFLNRESLMFDVYNCLGSLSPQPKYFKLRNKMFQNWNKAPHDLEEVAAIETDCTCNFKV